MIHHSSLIKQNNTPLLPTPKINNNYYVNRNVAYPNKATTVTTPVPNNQVVTKYPALPSPAPRKMLSQKEFADKRAKSQCFYCDKKYVPGHKCEWQMITLEIRGSGIEECLEEGEKEESDMISMNYKNYVLDQRLTTPFQSKWLPKLLGYEYEIEYKKGADKASADGLSRIKRQWVLFSLLAGTSNEIMDAVVATWSSDSSLQAIIKGLQDKTLINIKYSWQND
ncbi:hypothetical protein Tco_1268183 [Tanacetum coccineum]